MKKSNKIGGILRQRKKQTNFVHVHALYIEHAGAEKGEINRWSDSSIPNEIKTQYMSALASLFCPEFWYKSNM